jgi:hypothetical protein
MDPEIVAALIAPVLTAGLAALAVGFKEWQRRRESVSLARLADRPRRTVAPASAAPPPGPPGYPPRPNQTFPGPVPSQPGQVSAGYPPPG